MPLLKGKSQKAFEHNIKAEVSAGKPLKQSIAIAYSMKRRAKLAHGGLVEQLADQSSSDHEYIEEKNKEEEREIVEEFKKKYIK